MTRPRPKTENLDKLRETILGFCGALEPPTVYMPANTRDRFPVATALHEKCHALLINSTTYGLAWQILTYLLKSGCPHLSNQILKDAIASCIENSFYVHEGCATLTEISHIDQERPEDLDDFILRVDDDYKRAASLLSAVVEFFDFQGYLETWMACQIAAVCLSPPLFGPFREFENYKNGRIVELFSDDMLSADARLERLRSDSATGRLSSLLGDIKVSVNESVCRVFGRDCNLDWKNSRLRHEFVRHCEPLVERSFATAYPGFYSEYHSLLDGWEYGYSQIVANFRKHSCDCLSRFTFAEVDLIRGSRNTRVVSVPGRKGHAGAHELESLDSMPRGDDIHYYVALAFSEQHEPIVICEDPPRVLEEGHLYARFQPYQLKASSPRFASQYWFMLVEPSDRSPTLVAIAELSGVRVCTVAGDAEMLFSTMADCCRQSLDGIYLQLDGITAEGFREFVQMTSARHLQMFFLSDENERNCVLFLKDKKPGYHSLMPVTTEILAEILEGCKSIGKIQDSVGRPNLEDYICYQHICQHGW
jgi:hypothetical protein